MDTKEFKVCASSSTKAFNNPDQKSVSLTGLADMKDLNQKEVGILKPLLNALCKSIDLDLHIDYNTIIPKELSNAVLLFVVYDEFCKKHNVENRFFDFPLKRVGDDYMINSLCIISEWFLDKKQTNIIQSIYPFEDCINKTVRHFIDEDTILYYVLTEGDISYVGIDFLRKTDLLHRRRDPKEPRSIDEKDKHKIKTYLIKDKMTGYYKIGRSVDPERRLSDLSIANPSISLHMVIFDDVELTLHKKYSSFRRIGEWFRLSEKEIEEIKTDYKHLIKMKSHE